MEDEMHKSGINVNFTTLKDHLLHLQDAEPGTSALEGEFVEVSCNSPRHFHSGTVDEKVAQPLETTWVSAGTKTYLQVISPRIGHLFSRLKRPPKP